MRSRRLIIGVVTVLVAVLLGPATAAQAFPESSLSCTSESNFVFCELTVQQFRGTPGVDYNIEWQEGGPARDQDADSKFRSFHCSALAASLGRNVRVTVVITPKPRNGSSFAHFANVKCNGNLFGANTDAEVCPTRCQPTLTALAGLPGGRYIVCDVVFASNTGSCPAIRWVAFGGTEPAVSIDCAEGWTSATFDCNVYDGGPDYSFSAYPLLTFPSRIMQPALTIPCGW